MLRARSENSMKKYGLAIVMCAPLVLLMQQAVAQTKFSDPCRSSYYQAAEAQHRLNRAELVFSRQNRAFASSQDLVAERQARLQSVVDSAALNLRNASQVTTVQVTTCAVGWFFWYQYSYNCANRAVDVGIERRLRAKAAYNAAVSRKNSYAVYAEGYLRRQALRVEEARREVAVAVSARDTAQGQYSACRASNPCRPAGTYGRCY